MFHEKSNEMALPSAKFTKKNKLQFEGSNLRSEILNLLKPRPVEEFVRPSVAP